MAFDTLHQFELALMSNIINVFVIQELKELLAEPGLCHLMPSIALFTATSYGFPSGAAQGFLAIFGFLGITLKKFWFWLLGVLFVLPHSPYGQKAMS